jgi:biotin transporter BioY
MWIGAAFAIGCFAFATWTTDRFYVILFSAAGGGAVVFLWVGVMVRLFIAPISLAKSPQPQTDLLPKRR